MLPFSPLLLLAVSMDGYCLQASLVLKAAQAGLANGLTWLRVATAAHGSGAPLEGGESLVVTGMSSPILVGASVRNQLSQFLPGGLGSLGGEWRELAWGSAPFWLYFSVYGLVKHLQ
jgi:hypothetical protein